MTINGNNHTIDGANMAGAFLFKGKSNVTINDLTFKNCGISAIGILGDSKVTLNNVKFINNHETDSGAAIYIGNAAVNISNALFENNDAPNGGAIFAENGILTLSNATFTNKNPLTWSFIYTNNVTVLVENSTFAN